MGKLSQFRRWLLLPEAARDLSAILGEEVSEADLLRLALDRELTLSVHFIGNVTGQRGKIVPRTEARLITLPTLDGAGEFQTFEGISISEDAVLELMDDIRPLGGVWDLPMMGGELNSVEWRYHGLTGGPEVELTSLDGTFVTDGQGVVWRLMQRFEKHFLKAPIVSWYDRRNFYPAGELPEGCILVVRMPAFRELESKLATAQPPAERPLGQRERSTLLVMVAALARLAKIDIERTSSAAASIESQTSLLGARIAARTIEEHLKRVGEALERRS